MNRIAFSLIASVTLLSGCSRLIGVGGDGVIKSEDRQLPDFTRIVVAGAYQIKWTGGDPTLNISTDQNLLPLIKTSVSDGTLRIGSKDNLRPKKNITITLSSTSLADVKLTGANSFKAGKLSGSDLKIESTGASNITVDGSVANLKANLTGASKLNAKSLKTQVATLSLLGASNADVTVTDSLKASVTGAGSLTYSGDPKLVEKNVTGVGSIRQRP